MTRSCNILFTGAGRRVSLIRLFREALHGLGLQGKIVSADLQELAAAAFVSDAHELLPPVENEAYLIAVEEVCRRHAIDLVIPLIDPELSPLAEIAASLRTRGVQVLVGSPAVNRICSDKRETYAFFKRCGIRTPELLDPAPLLADDAGHFPVFLKPARGSSSIGATKIRNTRELAFFLDYVSDAIVQEYAEGDEYTLDVLADLEGRVRCVVPRLRIETRAGEISKGMTVKNRDIIAAGKQVVEALPGVIGCVTVQCFLGSDGAVTFTEINPRFGGGFPLSARAGANFPRWIIELLLGDQPAIAIDGWEDGVLMLRYDEGIFASTGGAGGAGGS